MLTALSSWGFFFESRKNDSIMTMISLVACSVKCSLVNWLCRSNLHFEHFVVSLDSCMIFHHLQVSVSKCDYIFMFYFFYCSLFCFNLLFSHSNWGAVMGENVRYCTSCNTGACASTFWFIEMYVSKMCLYSIRAALCDGYMWCGNSVTWKWSYKLI